MARMESKEELPCFAEKEKVLVLEEDVHLESLQTAECHQEVHAVPAKAADRLCVDKVDLPLLTIGHHLLEPWTGVDAASGLDVGIGIDVLPMGMVQYLLFLEIHLGREAVQLPFHLRADAAVQGHTLAPVSIWNGLDYWDYTSLSFRLSFIWHDWSCIARIVGDE